MKDNQSLQTQVSFQNHWRGCDLDGLRQDLASFEHPDYLVAPTSRLCQVSLLGYRLVKQIHSFSIFRRMDQSLTSSPTAVPISAQQPNAAGNEAVQGTGSAADKLQAS